MTTHRRPAHIRPSGEIPGPLWTVFQQLNHPAPGWVRKGGQHLIQIRHHIYNY
jgi:hypothetical protein